MANWLQEFVFKANTTYPDTEECGNVEAFLLPRTLGQTNGTERRIRNGFVSSAGCSTSTLYAASASGVTHSCGGRDGGRDGQGGQLNKHHYNQNKTSTSDQIQNKDHMRVGEISNHARKIKIDHATKEERSTWVDS